MQRPIFRLPPLALLAAAAAGCGGSPAEPDRAASLAVAQLEITVSSALAVGRTVRPTVGAYAAYSASASAPIQFFYPADSGATAQLASTNAGVLRVNGDATVTAVAAGTAYLTAALGGRRDSVLVSVIPGYEVTLLAGTESITLADVNDAGDVAGYVFPDYTIYTTPGNTGVMLRGGVRTDIGNCYPAAINNAGQIGCNPYGPGGRRGSRPAIYANGVLTFPFADSVTGAVTGISESGRIYGTYAGASGSTKGVFVGGSAGMDYTIPGYTTRAGSINTQLHGVAISDPCMYCSGMIHRPEGPGPVYLFARGRSSHAWDINDADNVIGDGEDMAMYGGTSYGGAFLWRKANGWKPESFSPRAGRLIGISERDQILGIGADGAYVWDAGRYTFLADAVKEPGWSFQTHFAISRSGVVAAYGEHPSLGKGIVLIRLP
jgi:hypothetical protein